MVAVHRLGLAQLVGALLERGIAGVGPSFVPTRLSRAGVVVNPKHRSRSARTGRGRLSTLEVFIDQRVVGDEDAMLQGQIHRRWCLAAARWGHQDPSALSSARMLWPSSCSIAYSTAAIRAL